MRNNAFFENGGDRRPLRVFESDGQADTGKERTERKAQQWRKQMKSRNAYPSDVTDAQWKILEPLIPAISAEAVIVLHERREIVNGILYVLRSGCPWRLLPHDLPAWGTVYSYFRTWRNEGIWDQVLATLRHRMRQQQGREASPSAAVIDSQSMKTSAVRGPEKGIDRGKKNLGTQTTRLGGYRRQSPGSQSHGGQHFRPSGSQAVALATQGALSPPEAALGRQSLRRDADWLGQGAFGVGHSDRASFGDGFGCLSDGTQVSRAVQQAWLLASPQAMGGGAKLCLDDALASPLPRS